MIGKKGKQEKGGEEEEELKGALEEREENGGVGVEQRKISFFHRFFLSRDLPVPKEEGEKIEQAEGREWWS